MGHLDDVSGRGAAAESLPEIQVPGPSRSDDHEVNEKEHVDRSRAPASRGLVPAADSDQQLSGDIALRDYLAEKNFAGPEYDLFERSLVSYGLGVMNAWIYTGEIFRQASRRGYSIGKAPYFCAEDDCRSMANETVARALVDFRQKGLREGRWVPTRGASMKTYFITACVFHFLASFRRWQRDQNSWSHVILYDPADTDLLNGPFCISSEDVALNRLEVGEVCKHFDDHEKSILVLQAMGYRQAEIAEILGSGLSARAVEGALYRMRKSMLRARGEDK